MKKAKNLKVGLYLAVITTMVFGISAISIQLAYAETDVDVEQILDEPVPVLSVIKTVDKALVNPSDVLSYTVTVSNSGEVDALNVMILDTLPAGLTFANDDGSNSGDTERTWTLEEPIAPGGDSTPIKYDVLVDSNAGVGTYTNTAIATSYADDHKTVIATSKPATASTEVHIPVVLGETAPSLTIEKSVAESFVNSGGTVTYTVKVTNNGDAPALNAVLDDVLPAGFVFADTGTTTASWNLGDIVPTESVTKTYQVKVDAATTAGNYVNTATVSADDVDGVSAKANLEVKEIQVLGAEAEEELPTTGGGLALILGSLMLAGTGIAIRRKLK